MFKQRVHFKNGRYEVELPWKRDSNELSDNFSLAKRRLGSLMRKMQRDKVLYSEYCKVLKNYLDEGIIEKEDKKKRDPKMSGVKKKLSGSQKRKIRKEKEYNINSKYAKLDNFLISASSSSCARELEQGQARPGIHIRRIWAILKNNAKILSSATATTTSSATRITRSRNNTIEEMEKRLSVWIDDGIERNMILSQSTILIKRQKIRNTEETE
ncbi:uncharacterized protein LOC102076250 [Trichonephila clavipes]|nr:uncharacterized protein LOC102076250 [Trichonephila clavipes]